MIGNASCSGVQSDPFASSRGHNLEIPVSEDIPICASLQLYFFFSSLSGHDQHAVMITVRSFNRICFVIILPPKLPFPFQEDRQRMMIVRFFQELGFRF